MNVFTGLQHIVAVVRDAETAVRDWERCFGAKTHLYENDHAIRGEFAIGESSIVLLQPLGESSPYWQFLNVRGQGVCAVALQVNDVELVAQRVKQRGARVTWDEARSHASINSSFANGVRIELWPTKRAVTGPPLFRRVHHLVVATHGTEAAASGWRRLFADADENGDGAPNDVPSHIAAGQAYFGLVDAADHPPPVAKFLQTKGEGVYIVSVVDDDVDGTVRLIRERGGRIVGDETSRGQLFVHPSTTHGILLEINDEEYSRNWTATYGDPPFDR